MSAAPSPVPSLNGWVRVYVWQLPVRITHWLIFLSVLVLAATGFYIGHPFISVSGRARDHFVMGTVRVVHLYAAIVFALSVLVRAYWLLAGNRYARWDQFIPTSRWRLRSTWETIRFYAFVDREPAPYPGHSGLAGAAYAIVFLIELTMIATGLALYTVYAPADSVFQWPRVLIPLFGGLQMARLIHHIGMWLLLMFMVHHVYSVILFSIAQRSGIEFDAMFSGYKRRSGTAEQEAADG